MKFLRHPAVHLAAVLVAVLGLHLVTARHSEPFFNNDETRHTMTGVFFADAVRDLPASLGDPKGYAIRYYCQYPGIGIITWPPFFYLVEGAAILAFGPHFLVGRWCVAGFAALAVVYTYRWAKLQFRDDPTPRPPPRTGEGEKEASSPPLRFGEGAGGWGLRSHLFALLAAALTGLSPLVFVHSQRVMLDVPTLALLLVAITHFEQYLGARRGRDAILACLFAAFAALTRFDGCIVGLYFLLRLLSTWNFRLLMNRPVFVGIGVALLLTGPYYALTWSLYGSGIGTAVTAGTSPDSTGLFHPENIPFYIVTLPEQAGWPLTIAAGLGLVVAVWRYRRQTGPAFTLAAVVYAFYTPLAQLELRYAIDWLPAVAVLACRCVQFVVERWGRVVATVLVASLVGGGVWEAQRQAFRYLFGYDDAAKWVLANRTTERPVLTDGELTTSFVYHMRRNDPARSVWVLRGDKLVYAMFSDPSSGYKQYARTEAEVLDRLETVDPEFVVIEDPPASFHEVPGAELLRATLKNHPERYTPAEVIPLRTNYDRFEEPGTRLVIYRKLHRNPNAAKTVEIEVIGLGRTLGATR